MQDTSGVVDIHVIESKLTDGSEVYAVELFGVRLDCVTQKDAVEFAMSFLKLVTTHTNYGAMLTAIHE